MRAEVHFWSQSTVHGISSIYTIFPLVASRQREVSWARFECTIFHLRNVPINLQSKLTKLLIPSQKNKFKTCTLSWFRLSLCLLDIGWACQLRSQCKCPMPVCHANNDMMGHQAISCTIAMPCSIPCRLRGSICFLQIANKV